MQRPRLTIEWKMTDWLMEGLSLLLLTGTIGFIVYHYPELPDVVPTHYSFTGTADSYGPKATLWLVVGINLTLYLLLTGAARIPHRFNYMTEITPENAPVHYSGAVRLLRYIKVIVSGVFAYLIFSIVQGAQSDSTTQVTVWFIPITLALLFGGIMYTLIKANRSTPSL